MPTSPTRLTMNALLAASQLTFSSYQKPISRYEQRPTSSQKMKIMKTFARGDQAEHREAKERQIGEKPRITRVVVHVAHRVDVDQGRDERDHEEHHDAQIVDRNAQGNRQVGLGGGRADISAVVAAAAPPRITQSTLPDQTSGLW